MNNNIANVMNYDAFILWKQNKHINNTIFFINLCDVTDSKYIDFVEVINCLPYFESLFTLIYYSDININLNALSLLCHNNQRQVKYLIKAPNINIQTLSMHNINVFTLSSLDISLHNNESMVYSPCSILFHMCLFGRQRNNIVVDDE